MQQGGNAPTGRVPRISGAKLVTQLVALFFVVGASRLWAAETQWQCTMQSVFDEIVSGQPVAVSRVDSLSADVLHAIGVREHRQLANPGEPWNIGCVQDGKTPGASLVFAARTSHVWFAHTEHGGFAESHRLVLLCRDGDGEHRYTIRQPEPLEPRSAKSYLDWLTWPTSLQILQRDLQLEWIVPDDAGEVAR